MGGQSIGEYWNTFLASLPPTSLYFGKTYVTERFGHTPELADELGKLVVKGVKTGTCSALWEWEADGHFLPHPGMISIVLDSQDQPLCIIEIVEVFVRRFKAVDQEFAQADGGYSLDSWREVKKKFFSRALPKIRREFNEDMPLVCVLFKIIYK
jgi:uncharacterized protein YhfF